MWHRAYCSLCSHQHTPSGLTIQGHKQRTQDRNRSCRPLVKPQKSHLTVAQQHLPNSRHILWLLITRGDLDIGTVQLYTSAQPCPISAGHGGVPLQATGLSGPQYVIHTQPALVSSPLQPHPSSLSVPDLPAQDRSKIMRCSLHMRAGALCAEQTRDDIALDQTRQQPATRHSIHYLQPSRQLTQRMCCMQWTFNQATPCKQTHAGTRRKTSACTMAQVEQSSFAGCPAKPVQPEQHRPSAHSLT